jgi:hypothetical protein
MFSVSLLKPAALIKSLISLWVPCESLLFVDMYDPVFDIRRPELALDVRLPNDGGGTYPSSSMDMTDAFLENGRGGRTSSSTS